MPKGIKGFQKGERYWLGKKRSEDTKKKISNTLRNRLLTEEHKKKISENSPKIWLGKKFSEIHRKKLSESHRGHVPWNKGKKFSIEYRRKLSEAHKGKNTGSKSPNWKGGISSENRRLRESLEYQIWRNEVYKRDNWTCRLCRKKCNKKEIVAHHLRLFSEFPELRFSVDNGITLCRSCHLKVHKRLIKI